MIKYELEYPIHSSINILYERLSSLSGLSEWFADNVDVDRDGVYTFTWEGSQQEARLVSKKKKKKKKRVKKIEIIEESQAQGTAHQGRRKEEARFRRGLCI